MRQSDLLQKLSLGFIFLISLVSSRAVWAALPTELKPYSGKVMLIVNTASHCGFTSQYKGLQAIYDRYKDRGLFVLGFPSNDFGGQEPGSDHEIRFFCESQYHVTFPLFKKASVTGSAIQPVFKWALSNSPSPNAIAWNFEKFLVGKDGKVVQRFKSEVDPDSKELTTAIERALSL
jgi:glutathione peroxidase